MYHIRMGQPEMEEFWNDLKRKVRKKTAGKTEVRLFHKIGRTLKHISENPRYPGLNTHEIAVLSERYGQKVWESYLENNKPAAGGCSGPMDRTKEI